MPKPYRVKDPYFLRAKQKGYRARSAFKLLDIQNKFHLIRYGDAVVDLGAAPGSFLQVIEELVGPKGKAFGIDLQEIEPFKSENIQTAVADVYETEDVLRLLKEAGFGQVDGVTSDLAPKTTGIRDVDQGQSVELTRQAFEVARLILKPRGYFIAKVFDGPDLGFLIRAIKPHFKTLSLFKAPASRDRSFERYIIGVGFKKI